MRSIVITGVCGPLARLLLPLLGPELAERVVGVDVGVAPAAPPGLGVVMVGPTDPALAELLADVETVVLLPRSHGLAAEHVGGRSAGDVETARRVLTATGRAGVRSVVCLSSATVYGAWPDNAVPLTEDATLRPNPGLADAIEHAEVERLVSDWADAHPGAAVAVLRAVATLGRSAETALSRGLCAHSLVRPGREDPPRQFVHADDVASAVALAVRQRLDGVFNVAPNGSVPGEVLRDLSAGTPALPAPAWLASVMARLSWALRISPSPPILGALVRYPWVVANDRLRSEGWEPSWSTEEAVVAGRRGGRWREMGPGHRQEVSLVVAAGMIAAAAGSVAIVAARARSRRRVRSFSRSPPVER